MDLFSTAPDPQTDSRSAAADMESGAFRCESCGGATVSKAVDVTMWTAERLVLIENVPAHICQRCEAQYYEEDAGMKIQALVSRGFPAGQKTRELVVPVFTLDGIPAGHLPEEMI